MNNLDRRINNSVLAEIIGADGVEELKTKLIDMIVEQVRTELDESSDYIISPDELSTELYNDIYESVKESVYEDIKENVAKKVMGKFDIAIFM